MCGPAATDTVIGALPMVETGFTWQVLHSKLMSMPTTIAKIFLEKQELKVLLMIDMHVTHAVLSVA
jgi:hypothetical protein